MLDKLIKFTGARELLIDFVLLAAVVVGLLAAKAGYDRHQRGIGAAEVQAHWDAEKVTQQHDLIVKQAADAAETERRLAAQRENINETTAQLNRARADADAARTAGQRLRAQLAKYVASHNDTGPGNPGPAGVGEAAGSGVTLLADLFQEADATAGELAQALDRSRAAGLACERAYESLKASP